MGVISRIRNARDEKREAKMADELRDAERQFRFEEILSNPMSPSSDKIEALKGFRGDVFLIHDRVLFDNDIEVRLVAISATDDEEFLNKVATTHMDFDTRYAAHKKVLKLYRERVSAAMRVNH